MSEVPRFIDPHTLSRLSNMELRARAVVEGFIAGLHKSPYRGFSVEFAEYREYTPGDDIRHIDWKVMARSDRYYVKEFEEETNLQSFVLLDRSASMGYASNGISKLDYGSYLAASLSYFISKQHDGIGFISFDQDVVDFLPAHSKPAHVHTILTHLEQITPGKETDLGKPLHEMADMINRRGMIIIISDLIDEPERTMDALQHFRFKGHDVIVFHIMDPDELDFPFTDTVKFKDSETGEELTVLPTLFKQQYHETIQAFLEENRQGCLKLQADYVLLNTGIPLDMALFTYLAKRSRMY
ncbi:MAG: DUF58 domain-containing protein [Gemmatimonadota bacterium]|nr:DUF58 domain-containing protein [Gemmatimonadota bacterium]